MGARTGSAVAATTLLICSACGTTLADLAPTTSAEPVAPSISIEVEEPFTTVSPDLRTLATAFVRATCVYDARKEPRAAFLDRARELATDAEAARLSDSPRARLNWTALRGRHERTRIKVTGVTQLAHPTEVRLVVEFVRTTTTGFATVREFDRMTLTLVETTDGPRVDTAMGGGL